MYGRVTIAIDGTAGSGKSTIAKKLASLFGYSLMETCAIYRSVAWFAKQEGISFQDEESLVKLAENLKIDFNFDGTVNHVFVVKDPHYLVRMVTINTINH